MPAFIPRPIVVCGPSGSGKSTLLKRIFAEYPDKFGFSVSHTTRKPRQGEVNGKDYHFVERSFMEQEIRSCKFIENAEFSGNLYGTSITAVQSVLESGKNVVLDIEMQGVKQLQSLGGKKLFSAPPLFIFIAPPSLQILEERLRARGTETEDAIQKRLDTAKGEMEWGTKPGAVDHLIVNDNVEDAYKKFVQIIFS